MPAVRDGSAQLATQLVDCVACGATAAQPAIVLAPSLKATVPVSVVLPEGTGMLAVKVTVWFTEEVGVPLTSGEEELSVMLDVAALTVCDAVPVLPVKLESLA